jgi:hypothetical protein
MMSQRVVQLHDRTVLFSPDDLVSLASRLQALVKLQVTDELTGKAPDGEIRLQVKERNITWRMSSDGVGGLIGIPQQVFPALRTIDYVVHFTVHVTGYESRDLEVTINKHSSFPDGFTPTQVNLSLHRKPIVITGRTTRLINGAVAPMASVQVKVTGIWRTPPPANTVVAPDPPNFVSLHPPLYTDRAASSQFLRRQNLVPVTGNDKKLTGDHVPGSNLLRLSNRLGLAVGDIILIDAGQPDLAEFIAVKTVPTTSPADQTTSITLDYSPIYAHRRGTIVRTVTPQPPGANRQFAVDAFSGDTCIFLSNLTSLATAQEVQISGPPGPDEYHKMMQFSVVSDADGYYRLPPLNRVAQLELHAEKTVGAQTFKTTTAFRPDYRQRENHLDFLLTV